MKELEQRVENIEKNQAVCEEKLSGMEKGLGDRFASIEKILENHAAFYQKVVIALLIIVGGEATAQSVIKAVGHTDVLVKAEFGAAAFGYIMLMLYIWFRVFQNGSRSMILMAALFVLVAGLLRISMVDLSTPCCGKMPLAAAVPYMLAGYTFLMEAWLWKQRTSRG